MGVLLGAVLALHLFAKDGVPNGWEDDVVSHVVVFSNVLLLSVIVEFLCESLVV